MEKGCIGTEICSQRQMKTFGEMLQSWVTHAMPASLQN